MRLLGSFKLFTFFYDKVLYAQKAQKAPKSTKNTKNHQKHKKHQKAQKRNQAKVKTAKCA